MRNAPARVSAPPRALRKRSGRWRRSRCGLPEREVAAQRLGRRPSERDEPLLAALADDADDAALEVDRRLDEPDRLRARGARRRRAARRARGRASTRGVVPVAASTSRSASAGESVRGTVRGRRGPVIPAAGLSARWPMSVRCARYERTAARRRAIVAGARPSARIGGEPAPRSARSSRRRPGRRASPRRRRGRAGTRPPSAASGGPRGGAGSSRRRGRGGRSSRRDPIRRARSGSCAVASGRHAVGHAQERGCARS